MNKLIFYILAYTQAGLALGQYDHTNRVFQPSSQYNTPPPSILLHKQALGQDGSFNYAFAADNGLQQGEIINPDGSRRGSYSYVDPNGKTVSLSYTAGKDGFKVVEGDHVPKTPEQHRQRPNSEYYQHHQLQRQNPQYFTPQPNQDQSHFKGNGIPYEAYKNAPNAPVYRGNPTLYQEPYRNSHPAPPLPVPHAAGQYKYDPNHYEVAHRPAPQSVHFRPAPQYQPRQYSVQEGSYEKPAPYVAKHYQGEGRQEESQKPHSFGNGFAFEFAG